MDEFLDHWQSTLQPTALALVQNKLMWKLFFRLKEPNKQAVAAAEKATAKQNEARSLDILSKSCTLGQLQNCPDGVSLLPGWTGPVPGGLQGQPGGPDLLHHHGSDSHRRL